MSIVKFAMKTSLLLPLVLGALPAHATVPNPYGAIAYSPTDGLYGVAQKNVELEAAEQEAIGNCAVLAGGRSCRIVISYRNACGALAVSDDGAWGADSAVTTRGELMKGINDAYAKARDQCVNRGGTSCHLEQASCSFADD